MNLAGRIDTIANQITITPEREAKYVFTSPCVYDGRGSWCGQEMTPFKVLRICPVKAWPSTWARLREQPNADEIDIRTYESNIEQDVALDRVEAFVVDRVSATEAVNCH